MERVFVGSRQSFDAQPQPLWVPAGTCGLLDALPKKASGTVLKRSLRDSYGRERTVSLWSGRRRCDAAPEPEETRRDGALAVRAILGASS
jgi:hypothetical protein